ncbi:MAG: LysR family transcriptional regulator [Dermatophilaceae bacterium]
MTPPANLAALRTFLAAYRAGSMTAAADELGLSQPGVTAQIRALEQARGTALFTRRARGVSPTPAGEELAARIGPHLDALLAAVEPEPSSDPFRRMVLLGGPPELMALRVLPSLTELFARGIRLRISTGLADILLADAGRGGLDLAVSTVRPRGRRLGSTPIGDEEFVLVAAPRVAAMIDGAEFARAPRPALATLPLVAYSEGLPVIRRYWRHAFDQPAPSSRPAVLVGDLRAVAAAAAAGAGYTVLPRYLAADHFDAGTLVALYEPETPPINTFHLAWPAHAASHPAVDAVRDCLVAAGRRW